MCYIILTCTPLFSKVPGTAANAERAIEGDAPEEEKPMPDVPPPDFINCCKAVLLNFGNLNIDDEQGDLSAKIKQIASEAEVVATRIYGKGMSTREQQVSCVLCANSFHFVTQVMVYFNGLIIRSLLSCFRIVHGKNRQHQSLILKHLKSKQRGEEKQLHGRILTQEMNCSLDLDQMERCRLVDHKKC